MCLVVVHAVAVTGAAAAGAAADRDISSTHKDYTLPEKGIFIPFSGRISFERKIS
jgi:hypothetical protein